MSYFQSEEHFLNFVNKHIRENATVEQIDYIRKNNVEILLLLEKVYKSKLRDRFSWLLRQGEELLFSTQKLKDFLIENTQPKYDDSYLEIVEQDNTFTKIFRETYRSLNHPGCYLFSNSKRSYLYIGMSYNLQGRVLSSYKERGFGRHRAVFFEYYATETTADAAILEAYLIGHHQPILNSTLKYDGKPKIKFANIPEISKRIRVNEKVGKTKKA